VKDLANSEARVGEPETAGSGPGALAAVPTPTTIAHNLGLLTTVTRFARVGRLSGLYLWTATIVVFAFLVPETFLTSITAKGILGEQAVTAIVALGVLVALTAGVFDLSVGQNVGFSAVLVGWLSVNHGQSAVVTILVTLVVGAAIGAANATLVVVVGIDSFIATLGSSSILLALTQIVSDQQFIGPIPESLQTFATWQFAGVSGYIYYALGLAILCWVALEHTAMGRRVAATGANKDAARLVGIATSRHQFVGLVASAVFASVAGIMIAGKTGSISPTIGPEYLLPAFAACFLSATQFKPGRFNVWGLVLALLLLGTGSTGLRLLGGQGWVSSMFTGVALIVAVGVAVIGQRRMAASGP
jgi:ribose transport system permease protein